MNRPRDAITGQTPRRYLQANVWQVERIKEGIAAAQDGRVRPAGNVFADIAAKHGWDR